MTIQVETIGNATLYCGDARDIIPSIPPVDVVLSDPPYGTEKLTGSYRRGKSKKIKTIKNDKDLSVVITVMRLLAGINKNLFFTLFHSARNEPEFYQAFEFLEFVGAAVWDKKAPGLGGKGFRYQHEPIAFYKQGEPGTMSALFSVIRCYRDASNHPHQKPQGLMQRLVESMPHGLILDPFMGSGSTLVACSKLNKPVIGIELNEEFFHLACERVQKARAAPDMFATLESPPIEAGIV